jgi:antirestriction protein ArdC
VNDWERERLKEERQAKEYIKPLVVAMRKGEEEWKRSWSSKKFLSFNVLTGRQYSGCNLIRIASFKDYHGYEHDQWLTELEGQSLGWPLRKGAIPCSILFPTSFRYLRHTTDEITGELIRDRVGKPLLSGSKPEEFRFAKIYNVSDFKEGYCPQRTIKEMIVRINRTIKLTKPDLNRISRASKLCDDWNRKQCKTSFAGDRACYDPTQDTIKMPALPDFDSVDEFYSVWLHEIIHSTGHPYRLGRLSLTKRDHASYAMEELVAELGSFLLCQKLGLETKVGQHAAYLNHWANALEETPRIIFKVSKESNQAIYLIRKNAGFPKLGPPKEKLDGRDGWRIRELGPVRHSRLPAFERSKAFVLG